MSYDYDLLVIGGGSAGLATAQRAARYGATVAVVEQGQLGGVCVNRGCVPKKLMVYAADVAHWLEAAADYGWQIGQASFHWRSFLTARDQVLEAIRQSYTQKLKDAGITMLHGHAAFVDPHHVTVANRRISAQTIVIAVGGQPLKPDISGIEAALTSREMFGVDALPQQMAILGGGYIGVEFAHVLARFGVEITLLNHEECLLTGFDQDLSATVQQGLEQLGVKVLCNTTITSMQPQGDGFEVTLDGSRSDSLMVDQVLCATGRKVNLDGLNLEQAGVTIDQKAIAVDEYSRTSQPHIYAVGDCTNRMPLTPVARAEGIAVAETVFGPTPRCIDYTWVPSAVFAHPEAATVGLTEADARQQHGNDIQCHHQEFRPLFNRIGKRPSSALLKLVTQRSSGRVLGVHAVFDGAAEAIQGLALALKQGITQSDLEAMIGIHPTALEELFG